MPHGISRPGVLLLEGCRYPSPACSEDPVYPLITLVIQPPPHLCGKQFSTATYEKLEMTMIHYGPHHGSSPRATHSYGMVWRRATDCAKPGVTTAYPLPKAGRRVPALLCAWETGIPPTPQKGSTLPLLPTVSRVAAGTAMEQPPLRASPGPGSSIARHSQGTSDTC